MGHMGKLVADITMSLDGFITGPDDLPGRGLGEGGECLHNWVMGRPWRYDDEGRRFDPLDVDRKVLWEGMGSTGAGIIGRGADVIQQDLAARLVDELRLHLAPVLLGAGKRLFDHLGSQAIELERT